MTRYYSPEKKREKKRWQPAQCGKKVQHNSYEAAKDHANKLAEDTQIWQEVYVCPWCNYWHVGRMAGKGKPIKVKRGPLK